MLNAIDWNAGIRTVPPTTRAGGVKASLLYLIDMHRSVRIEELDLTIPKLEDAVIELRRDGRIVTMPGRAGSMIAQRS